MKRRRTLCLSLVFALVMLLVAALFACNDDPVKYSLTYSAKGYSVGGQAEFENITALDIEWFAGELVFEKAEEGARSVRIRERAASDRGDAMTLHYLVDDGTLFVKCAAPGSYLLEGYIVKTLVVYVPDSLCFESVKAKGYSVNVMIKDVMSKRTNVVTHSGAVRMDTAATNMATNPRDISLKTFSGGITLNAAHPLVVEDDGDGKISVSTASGNVDVKINAIVPLLSVKTSSGRQNIELNQSVFELDIDSNSGLIELAARISPLKIWAETVESLLTFKLNQADSFEFVTDARLAVGTFDISHGEALEDGKYKYVYNAEGSDGSKRDYTLLGKSSVVYIEKVKA